VFEQCYGFEVHKRVIDSTNGPRKKLNKHLSTFLDDHDNPDTLLIFYYAGHGSAMPAEEGSPARDGFMLFELVNQTLLCS
jgi:caspase domain-containing protein